MALGHQAHLMQDRYRVSGGMGTFELHYDFFGIGNEAGDRGWSIPIAQESSGVVLQFLGRVRKHLYLGARYKIATADFTIDLNDLPLDPPIELPVLEINTRIASLGLRVEHDARESTFYPTAGSYSTLEADFSDEAIGSDYHYGRYELASNRYVSLREDSVLALRGFGCYADDDAPFFDLCLFGMGSDLRGYKGGQYRDRFMLSGQVEYRWQFRRRFGLVGFAGIGQVASAPAELSGNNLLTSGGIGLRYTASVEDHLNIRVDYAWGKDDSALYIAIGEAF